MPSPSPSFKILIIGGGVSGLALAIGLSHQTHHHQITILESTSSLQTLGGSLLIPPSAARVLDTYGIWARFLAEETPPPMNTTFRYRDGSVLESVDHGGVRARWGYSIMALTRAKYQEMLYRAAVEKGVDVRFGCRITGVEESERGPLVKLSTGESIAADVVIGADGIKSRVRSAVLRGKDIQPVPESFAYQAVIPRHLMRSDPLTAELMTNAPIHSWYGPGRQIIAGAKSDGDFYSFTLIVYPTPEDDIPDAVDILVPNSGSSYRKGDLGSMRKSVDMFEPRVRRFIDMVKEEDCFLWKIAYLPKLETWVSSGGRITLLGDAAHAMVPHLGMGAASAVEDGGVLSLCLARCASTEDIPEALRAYERIRKPRTEKIQDAALAAGFYKAMPDGEEQRKRDAKMKERMSPGHPRYEFWRAAGGLDWLYGYQFADAAKEELDKVFGPEKKGPRL